MKWGMIMKEKQIGQKKNGMVVLAATVLEYLIGIAVFVCGIVIIEKTNNPVLLIVGIIWMVIGWIPFLGLKVLKPQEALVLTLFGEYVGTLRDAGFYFVNPFCVSVNPAAET